MNYVVLDFGTPYANALTIDFKAGQCDSADMELTTNEYTGNGDDWLLIGYCMDGGVQVDLCCVLTDDGGMGPEVEAIGVRGTAGNDGLYLSRLQRTLFVDGDMFPDLQAFVFGEEGADTLFGTTFDLFSRVPVGDLVPTTLRGGPGNDTVLSQEGLDLVYGDAGNDYLEGGNGDDELWGGAGFDRMVGGRGADKLYGGADVDVLCGDLGDTVSCITSTLGENDELRLEAGGTTGSFAYGGGGEDTIYASTSSPNGSTDGLFGEDGNDLMASLVVNVEMYGGADDDKMCSLSTSSILYGGDGDDALYNPNIVTPATWTVGESGIDECDSLANPTCEVLSTQCAWQP